MKSGKNKKNSPLIFTFFFLFSPILAAVGNIDTSGISMLDEVKKTVERRGLKVVNKVSFRFCMNYDI